MIIQEATAIKKKLQKLDTIDPDNMKYIIQEIEKENGGVYYG